MDCQYEGDMPPPPRRIERDESAPFPAHWPGFCRGCHLPISEGQSIVRLGDKDDPDHEYRHESCS